MFIQDQLPYSAINNDNLRFYKAIGVDYLTVNPLPALTEYSAMSDFLKTTRALAERHGLRFYNAAMSGPDEITLALPNRDQKIVQWCNWIRAMGSVGIPTLGYNFKPIGNFRTTSAHGRGGVQYSTFDYEEFIQSPPSHPNKQIDAASMWDHLEYFLQHIVPVAQEANVRLALHPDDPPIPEPLAGAARIVSSLEQYERIFNLVPSPANAMLFCQGCVTEMGVDVLQAIRHIGQLNKIVYVHFRNIIGTPRNFKEVFVDEGQVDMYKAMQTYKECGFEGPFMMDHTPSIPDDQAGRQGHAYATGYIRALLQAVYR